jgi:hypothetical protein
MARADDSREGARPKPDPSSRVATPSPMSSPTAFADACRQVCEAQNWELLPTGIVVRWGDGRHQLVSLEHFEFEREELVRLSSRIGEAHGIGLEQLQLALETNARLAHGALAIIDRHLCMTDTLIVASADSAHIAAAVEYLARQADEYERTVFGTDEH